MLLTQAQACKKLNISRSTILNWEKQGLIEPLRTSGKHRRYSEEALLKLLGVDEDNFVSSDNSCVLYCRVSTRKQSESGNLARQLDRLLEFARQNNYDVKNIYSEMGSEINENRRELNKMIDYVKNNDIKYIIIEYKDRLARFGYKYIQKTCDILG